MSVHEQFAEDLVLHAFGTLTGGEEEALMKHLEQCSACQRELERIRGDMALLALSTQGPAPPQRSRQRLMDALAREPRTPVIAPKRHAWWRLAPALAAVAIAVLAAFLWRDNQALRGRLAELQQRVAQQQARLKQAEDVVATFTSEEAIHVTLVAVKTPPQPQGKAFYLRRQGSLIFLANNLPPAPLQKAYELWLIPISGAPIPAGLFRPDARGNATVINPPLPAGVQAKAFAITVEPESGSSAPTSQPIMLGAGE